MKRKDKCAIYMFLNRSTVSSFKSMMSCFGVLESRKDEGFLQHLFVLVESPLQDTSGQMASLHSGGRKLLRPDEKEEV